MYCIAAINSILEYGYGNLNIAISDNSASTKVLQYVEELKDPRITYRYDSGNVSSIENFNRAMNLATGTYVILIGDDDTILPKCIKLAEWAFKNNVDSVCSTDSAIYYWPGALKQFPGGYLAYKEGGGDLKKIDSRAYLRKLLNNGLQHYLLYPLPKTYHGLVKKSVLDAIKHRTGHYYGGLSPDIYSCVALSCMVKDHYVVSEALSIAGVCRTSTTADNIVGTHSGEIADAPHLKFRGPYVWDSRVPAFYSVNTIWAESGVKALEELQEYSLLKELNLYRLLVIADINNKKFIPKILTREKDIFRKQQKLSNIKFQLRYSKNFMQVLARKIFRVIEKKLFSRKSVVLTNIRDINLAVKKITNG